MRDIADVSVDIAWSIGGGINRFSQVPLKIAGKFDKRRAHVRAELGTVEERVPPPGYHPNSERSPVDGTASISRLGATLARSADASSAAHTDLIQLVHAEVVHTTGNTVDPFWVLLQGQWSGIFNEGGANAPCWLALHS